MLIFPCENRANDPGFADVPESMRAKYDAELVNWKKEAVDYTSHQQYATLFDRTIPWMHKLYVK